jgi:hypothetical protein
VKAIRIPNGIMHVAESKAVCPHCERHISFEEIDGKFSKRNVGWMRMKCKCKRFVGVTQDIRGDFVAYELSVGKKRSR